MATQTIVELNENNGPLFKGQVDSIHRVSLEDSSAGVDVVDIRHLADFTLVQLTSDLRDLIEFSHQDDYVGGLLQIKHVYQRTNVIGNVETNLTYFRRVDVADLPDPNGDIKRGNIFLSNIEYPQLASNATPEMIKRRFYHEGARCIQYKYDKFLEKYSNTQKNQDIFRHNQYEILLANAAKVKSMKLFENGPVYPEVIIEELEEGMASSNSISGLVDAMADLRFSDSTQEDLDTGFIDETPFNLDETPFSINDVSLEEGQALSLDDLDFVPEELSQIDEEDESDPDNDQPFEGFF